MIVKKNTPPPADVPPTTFDLIGLTTDEIMSLRSILARRTLYSLKPLENLRRQLHVVTRGIDQTYATDGLLTIRKKRSFDL